MQKSKLTLILLFSFSVAYSQNDVEDSAHKLTDSIRSARMDQAALMYPRIRQFSLAHQENVESNISSKLDGKDLFYSKFKSSRTTMNINLPILTQEKNTVAASLGMVQQFFGLRDVTNLQKDHEVSEMTKFIHMASLGISYIRRDSLFNRPITYSAVVNMLVNPSFSRRQFTFTGVVSIPVRRSENTNLMLGGVVLIDPSSPAPFFPFVSYFHKFPSLGLELMADLPYRLALRKSLSAKASFSAVADLVGSNSFFEFQNANPNLPKKLTFSSLEIKSGVLFEYRLTRKLVFSGTVGVSTTAKSRILEQGAGPNDYLIKNKNSASPYAQLGFSLLPFWNPFVRH